MAEIDHQIEEALDLYELALEQELYLDWQAEMMMTRAGEY